MAIITGTAELITAVLVDYHEIPADRAAGTAYANHRLRILRNAQHVASKTAMIKPHSYRYVSDSFTLAAGVDELDIATSVTDWGRLGPQGIFVIAGTGAEVTYKRLDELIALYEQMPTRRGPPCHFAIYGNRTARFWPPPDVDTELTFSYLTQRPILDDTDPGGLDYFPEQWIEHVIYPGVLLLEMRDKGAIAQFQVQNEIVKDAIRDMVVEEQQSDGQEQFFPPNPAAASLYEYE